MAKTTPETSSSIEALLEERARYEQWLARLDESGSKAPEAVRDRVRADYQSRLTGVIDQLRDHGATIAAELERHRTNQADLQNRRTKAEEELAEAEIRHAVGEYDAGEWERISSASAQSLDALGEELQAVENEIARLAEVQGLIAGEKAEPAPAAEPEPAPLAPAPAMPEQPPATPPTAEPAVTGPPRFVPRRDRDGGTRPSTPARPTEPADELAFLKSVGEPEEKRSPARRSLDSAVRSEPRADASLAKTAEPESAEAPTTMPPSPNAPGKGAAKTLKCADCGTLNRPTEWYCERCGAELAAM